MTSDRKSRGATANDIMTAPVLTVVPSMKIIGALAFMRQHSIRHLVVADGSSLQGIVSNRDYRRLLERADSQGQIPRLRETEVREIMTSAVELVTAAPDTPVASLVDLMLAKGVGSIIIVDSQRRPVGIVTRPDLLRSMRKTAR